MNAEVQCSLQCQSTAVWAAEKCMQGSKRSFGGFDTWTDAHHMLYDIANIHRSSVHYTYFKACLNGGTQWSIVLRPPF